MKRIVLLFSLIICSTHMNAMKRSRDMIGDKAHKKPKPNKIIFSSLPVELQNIVFEFMTTKITASKQKDATQAIRALSHVNKFYNVKVNNPSFSDALIDTFSRRFYCAHETIARNLATPAALQRLAIQKPLKQLCVSNQKTTVTTFNDIIDVKKVNLEFTYTHNSEQKTALMISIDYSNNMYERLLENGAKINGCNAQGWSALSLAAKSKYAYNPYRRLHFYKLIQQPKIELDHQNLSQKSPLYILLQSLKKYRFYISGHDIAMVRALLQAGADPELPDTSKKKITPTDLAYKIYDFTLIGLLEEAIENKHSKQKTMAIDS